MGKNVSSKYNQKPLDHAEKSAADDLISSSKTTTQKTIEATVNLIGNKIPKIL